MSAWTLYLITRLDDISVVISISFFLFLISFVITTVMFLVIKYSNEEDNNENFMSFYNKVVKKKVLPWLIILSLFLCFIPSEKETIAIYVIPKIVNNEQIQDISEKTLNVLQYKLNEWIDDIKDGGNK